MDMRSNRPIGVLLALSLFLLPACESDRPRNTPLTAAELQELQNRTMQRRARSLSPRDISVDTSSYNSRTYSVKARDLPPEQRARLEALRSTDPDGSPKPNIPN